MGRVFRPLLDAYVSLAFSEPRPSQSSIVREVIKAGLEVKISGLTKDMQKRIRTAAKTD
jgi:hypothetical protein